MKKLRCIIFQIVLGIVLVNLFWIAAYIINDPYGDFRFTKIEEMLFEIPWFVCVLIPICISLLIIISGFIGKKCGLKIMFWFHIASTFLPIIGYYVMRVCSDDSSILSLLLLPLMLVLQPFGIMCMSMLNNITMTLNNNIFASFNEGVWVALIVGSALFALVLYKATKQKPAR